MDHQFLVGHVIDRLKELETSSVDCVCTSPPYLNLRFYPGEPQIWSNGPPCNHYWITKKFYSERTAARSSAEAFSVAGEANQKRLKEGRWREEEECEDCGAVRCQLGQERQVDAFVGHLAQVFREVWRVLKPEGSLWLNLGDSYGRHRGKNNNGEPRAKSLIGVPWKVAFALMEEGWILRSDIIWEKPSVMPEPVTDRPTRSHEYLFFFVKQEKYYYNQDAVREPHTMKPQRRLTSRDNHSKFERQPAHRRPNYKIREEVAIEGNPLGRNKRSVWQINPVAYKGEHYAAFPPLLVEPALLAGCPEGGTVLDPFGGSGVVSQVAEQHGRNSILIDLDPACEQMTLERLEKIRCQRF